MLKYNVKNVKLKINKTAYIYNNYYFYLVYYIIIYLFFVYFIKFNNKISINLIALT